jgi:hypothetical protein
LVLAELLSLDEGVEELEDLPLVSGVHPLDLLHAPLKPSVRLRRLLQGGDAE